MIDSITLKNWKTHKNTSISFSKGTNILIGLMGAGKSSMMDAISYALFGTFPSLKRKKISVGDIITNVPKQENEASVELNFEIDENKYTVVREIYANSPPKATLKKNGAYLQSQPERVNEEIERLLKVDYDVFSRAIYSEQNQLDYFLELGPADRKRQIDELLGLDKFATAFDNATSLINKIRDEVKGEESSVSAWDLEKLKSSLNEAKEEKKSYEAKVEELERKLGAAQEEYEKYEKEFKEKNELLRKKNEIMSELKGLEGKAAALKRELEEIEKEKLPQAEEIEKELGKLNTDIENAKKSESEIEKKANEYTSSYAKAQERAKQMKEKENERKEAIEKIGGRSYESTKKQIDEENKMLEELQEINASYASQKKEIGEWLKELEKPMTKCPVCERDMDEAMRERLLEGKRRALESLDKAIERSTRDIEEKKKRIRALNDEANELKMNEEKLNSTKDLKKEIDAVVAELAEYKSKIDALEKEKADARRKIDELSESKSRLTMAREKIGRAAKYRSDIERYSGDIRKMKGEYESIIVDETQIEKLRNLAMAANSNVEKIKKDIESNQSSLKKADESIRGFEEQINKIEKVYADIERKRGIANMLSEFKTALEATQLVLRSRLIDAINNIMQQIWPELYPYGDYVSIMLGTENNSYELKVRLADGRWIDVDGIASGGERSIACLAMRVAFALVLVPNLKWIILDEPTHNIDQKGISKFITLFNDTLPKIVDQIFIITHDEALKQAVNSRIYTLTRDKEAGGATIVAQ